MKYGRRLRRFLATRVRNSADASDLAQEVFLRLMRVDGHETIRNPEAYLFTVAGHVLHQHTLRQSTELVTADLADAFTEFRVVGNDDPEMRAYTQQRLDTLERALAELPRKAYIALLLHRSAGYSIEEIGNQLGISRGMAKKYLARALKHCRDRRQEAE